ncbi:MAG: hypothetical protein Q8880_00620 [Bacteroidota bacterium]|nr:hypothetical protein [Bacteroidota bacterium]
MKNFKIAFFYPKFFPVTGGASVHGYYLAKGLHNKGYEIITFQNQKDDFTFKASKNIISLIYKILISDLVYVRFIYFGKTNYIPLIAKLLRKKTIVEFNSPSDELLMLGRNKNEVIKNDKKLKSLISYADTVIAISENMKNYCINELKCKNVVIVENGGEKIDISKLNVPDSIIEAVNKIKSSFIKTVIWSGTNTSWQGIDIIENIITKTNKNTAFILICNDISLIEKYKNIQNVFIFSDLSRDSVSYLTINSNIGLALYGDYSWSRYGFYGSSLKYFDYLINGLYVVATPLGHIKKDNFNNLIPGNNPDEIINFIDNFVANQMPDTSKNHYRSWEDVVDETDKIIKKLLKKGN